MGLDLPVHPDLIVGLEQADDAGVFRLDDHLAVVQTVDFVTPIVDDPFTFGRIAAANAFSDVYAMGARPITALNIAAFPKKTLPLEVLKKIFEGGLHAIREAGAVLVGGHTIDDPELKYGLCVTGLVHPDHVLTNGGAKPGDALILTKRIGTGIISTAVKNKEAGKEAVSAIIRSMTLLNGTALEAARAAGVRACTDVTGFGLIGHALEMACASGVAMEIDVQKVSFFEKTLEYATRKMVPGGAKANQAFYGPKVENSGGVSEALYDVLNDPQTSGGLLLAVPAEQADHLLGELERRGVEGAALVGRCVWGSGTVRLVN